MLCHSEWWFDSLHGNLYESQARIMRNNYYESVLWKQLDQRAKLDTQEGDEHILCRQVIFGWKMKVYGRVMTSTTVNKVSNHL